MKTHLACLNGDISSTRRHRFFGGGGGPGVRFTKASPQSPWKTERIISVPVA